VQPDPPQNIEAERSVLGAILLNGDAAEVAVETLGPRSDVFYSNPHGTIYKTMVGMHAADVPIDVLTLITRLGKKGKLEDVGGASYVADLTSAVPTSANIEHYARIVLECHRLRGIIESATKAASLAFHSDTDSAEIMEELEASLTALQHNDLQGEQFTLDAIVPEVIENRCRIVEGKVEPGLLMGVRSVDEVTQGINKGDLVVCAARPGVGKTAMLMNAVHHIGVERKLPVLIFSLEMPRNQLVERILSIHNKICIADIKHNGFLAQQRLGTLASTAGDFTDTKVSIVDASTMDITEMRKHARRWARENEQLGFIGIDYLQLMRGQSNRKRVEEIEETSRGLKALAKELHVPILALAQLNRMADQEKNPYNLLSHMKGGGSIEEDADKVIVLYPTKAPKGDGGEIDPNNVLGWCVAKHRGGPVGMGKLYFEKSTQQVMELSEVEQEPELPYSEDEVLF